MIAMLGSTYVCEQMFSLVNNNKTKSRSRLTDGHMKSLMTMVSNNKYLIQDKNPLLVQTMPSPQPIYTVPEVTN
jgi:hypothetical protein